MITIGKIREKSGLLIIVIGGALLLFILGEAVRSMGGFGTSVPPRGEVYGNPLDDAMLNEYTELFVSNSQRNAMNQGREFTEQDQQQAEDAAYNEVLRLTLLGREFEALGIAVNDAEIDAFMLGTDGAKQSESMMRFFPTMDGGGFDEQAFNDFLTQAEQNVVDPQSGFSYKAFYEEQIRGQIKNEREADKYVALLQYGTYVTTFEAEQEFIAENQVLSVSFVLKNFDISEVELSDEQFNAFYKEWKNHPKYKQKDSRDYTYAIVDILPSDDDKQKVLEGLKARRADFENAANDSTYVLMNSDNKFFNRSVAYSVASFDGAPNSYPQSVDNEFQNGAVGQVVGPYVNGDRVEMAKILGFQIEKQSWVRHILISANDEAGFASAQRKADSIVRVIQQRNNFVEMVTLFSEDPGSVSNGGEYKWFPEGQMVPEFNDYSFGAPLNKLGTVKTSYGIHIVEVLGRRDARKPYLAVVTKDVNPSEETIMNVEMEARDLWLALEENPNDFDSIASKMNSAVQPGTVYLENPSIFGLTPSAQSQILNFLFKKSTPLMSVNDPIRDGNRFLLVQLTRVIEEGAPDPEVGRKVMEIDAKKKYLAEVYAKEMNGKDLQAIADKIGSFVQNFEITFKQGTMGVGGVENIVVGGLFSGLKKGAITVPIAGSQGVFVVRIDDVKMRNETDDFSAQKENMQNASMQNVSSRAFMALMKYADHKDNRNKIKVGAY
jgi:peptidyl-prolyl cis-trans isomerase D